MRATTTPPLLRRQDMRSFPSRGEEQAAIEEAAAHYDFYEWACITIACITAAALQYGRAVRDLFDAYSAVEHNDAPRCRYLKFVPTNSHAPPAAVSPPGLPQSGVDADLSPFTLVLDWT